MQRSTRKGDKMTIYVRQDDRNKVFALRDFLETLPKAVFHEAIDEEHEPIRIEEHTFLASTVLKSCDKEVYAQEYERWLDDTARELEECFEPFLDHLEPGARVDLSTFIPSPFAIVVYLCNEDGGFE